MTLRESHHRLSKSLKHLYEDLEAKHISRMLHEYVLNLTGTSWLLSQDASLSSEELEYILNGQKRLIDSEPIQYVLGFAWFMDLKIAVTPDVLIPRPETEELVYLAAKELPDGARALDLCTGSGCIALGLKSIRPDIEVHGLDWSPKALEVAIANGQRLSINVGWHYDNVLAPTMELDMRLDAIISNPPYVPISESGSLAQHVRKEPSMALFVEDENPILFYDKILANYQHLIDKEGLVFFETHTQLAEDVLLRSNEYGFVGQILKDQFDRNRFVKLKKI